MKRALAILLLSSLCAVADAPKRSGHATAQWLVAGQEEGVIKTIVRLVVDDPWHVYWYNPGEAGMETSAEHKLPEGWKATQLLHPVPKRFKTGELHGFGHEGTVDYGLNITMPEGFKGNAELETNITWLSCNNDACIPGEMMLKLKVVDGKVVGPKIEAEAYAAATARFPYTHGPADKGSLWFQSGKNRWEMVVQNGDSLDMDLAKAEVFIETPELVPASANVKFKKSGTLWTGLFPRGEFAPQKPDECTIVLVDKGKKPLRLVWKRK